MIGIRFGVVQSGSGGNSTQLNVVGNGGYFMGAFEPRVISISWTISGPNLNITISGWNPSQSDHNGSIFSNSTITVAAAGAHTLTFWNYNFSSVAGTYNIVL